MPYKEKIAARKHADYLLIIAVVLVLLSFLLVFSSVLFGNCSAVFIIAIVIAMAVLIWIVLPLYRSWSKGAAGEESVAEILKVLEKEYLVMHDVKLPGEKGNIDHVVIGRTGIFVIETKNYGGHIICYGDDWQSHYEGGLQFSMKGRLYWKPTRDYDIGSPSKQIKRNAMILKRFLERYYPKLSYIWINCIVVFTNETATIELHDPTVTVSRTDQLIAFIKNNDTTIDISPDDFSNLGALLKEKDHR
jgi:hypothetical protein